MQRNGQKERHTNGNTSPVLLQTGCRTVRGRSVTYQQSLRKCQHLDAVSTSLAAYSVTPNHTRWLTTARVAYCVYG